MKVKGIWLALPLATYSAVVRLDNRQLGSVFGPFKGLDSLRDSVTGSIINSITGIVAPTTKAIKIQELTPRNPAAKRVRLTWGPYKIRGVNGTSRLGNSISMDPNGDGHNFRAGSDFPNDATILDGIVEIHNKDGKRLTLEDGIYTHHFLVVDIGKPQRPSFACENQKKINYVPLPGSVITGGAAEDAESHFATNNVVAGKKTGYYVKKDSPVVMTIDIVNSNVEDMDVYPSADIEYIPGRPDDYLDSAAVFVAVAGCDTNDGGIVRIPKGKRQYTLNSTGVIATEDAIMSMFRGHMHDGGSGIAIKVNDELVCDSQALYGGLGHVGKTESGKTWETIRDMVTCQEGVLVKKGDKISISAHYDLDAHPSREQHSHSGGGGGMLGGLSGGVLGKLTNMFKAPSEPGYAEQMAVMIVYTAPLNPKS